MNQVIERTEFLRLPLGEDAHGNPRRAGFEFELGNLTVEGTSQAMQGLFGGELEKISPFETKLHESRLGKVKILRDTQLLTSLKYRDWLTSVGVDFSPGAHGEYLEQEVDKLSRWLVPCEIVTEPLEFERFHLLGQLIDMLEQQEAQGTQDAIHYAFGLHINISIPDGSSQTMLAYLQAINLLVDWIMDDANTDKTRRFLTNYIDPFPLDYANKILTHDYQPSLSQLIDDYLEDNPTRNRALDMMPAFYTLDKERVLAGVDNETRRLIKGRPAFHYRLPDCRVGMEGWSLAQEWNRWYLVEVIANNEELRSMLITDWDERFAGAKLVPSSFWVSHINNFIENHQLLP